MVNGQSYDSGIEVLGSPDLFKNYHQRVRERIYPSFCRSEKVPSDRNIDDHTGTSIFSGSLQELQTLKHLSLFSC